MKKLFESTLCGWDESAQRVYVYEFDNQEEYDAFDEMDHTERCDLLGVFDEYGYNIAPGAIYHTYRFDWYGTHCVMHETVAYNV